MVIGNGMLATKFTAFANVDEVIIFASGVSNSALQPDAEYVREATLLAQTIQSNPNAMLVYFSTCSIYQPSLLQNKYVQHKLAMEAFVQAKANSYLVIRLSNPIGVTNNKNTVLNFFIDGLLNNKPMTILQNAKRNLIDIEDVYNVCSHIIKNQLFKNEIVNVAHPQNFTVPEILTAIEAHFHLSGRYTYVNSGDEPKIDLQKVLPIYKQLEVQFPQDYLPYLLQKYFSNGV